MSFLKKAIQRILILLFIPCNILIKNKLFFRLYNQIYENSPHLLVRLFVMCLSVPNKENEWWIKLLNGKKVKTLIHKDDMKSSQFPLSYKWHAPSLNQLEFVLDNYYGQDSCYIDIGANLGLRSLFALSSSRQTYMFEPNQELTAFKQEKADLNGFSNFEIIEKGLSSVANKSNLYIDKTSYLSSLNQDLIPENLREQTMEIEVITLDSFVTEREINAEFFMKIDVEGHELDVLKGADKTLQHLTPTLIIEINEKGNNIHEIFRLLNHYSYKVFVILHKPIGHSFLETVSISETYQDSKKHSNDFLFVHNEELSRNLSGFCL